MFYSLSLRLRTLGPGFAGGGQAWELRAAGASGLE